MNYIARLERLENLLLGASVPLAKANIALTVGRPSGFVFASDAQVEMTGTLINTWRRGSDYRDEVRLVGTQPVGQRPLGLFVRFVGQGLTEELFYMASSNVRRLLGAPGVMVKGSGCDIWLRMSKDASNAGLTMATLGWSLIDRMRRSFSEIEAMRVIFVVEPGQLMDEIRGFASTHAKDQEDLKERIWKSRGFDFRDCTKLAHCGQCSSKKICANIRKMERIIMSSRANTAPSPHGVT